VILLKFSSPIKVNGLLFLRTKEKVVGSGNSPKEALKESIKKGTKEPIFLNVPSTDRSFVL